MSIEDRQRWEHRHARASPLSPRESVLALVPSARTGALALDLACGQGRHAAVLARRGYDVVAMDVAGAGLSYARAVAPDAMLVQADVDAWPFAGESFDLVVQVDFLERRIFPLLAGSLRSGGLLLVDTFLDAGRPNAEGPSNPAFLLRPGELPACFTNLRIERYDETGGDTARASMLARKP